MLFWKVLARYLNKSSKCASFDEKLQSLNILNVVLRPDVQEVLKQNPAGIRGNV